MTHLLSTDRLNKKYGNLHVLKDISLQVEKGSVFGLLGPNGSGKTTTLAILLDIVPADSGTYQWFGETPSPSSRKRIGSILETPNFYGYLSAENNLKIACDIKGVPYEDIDRVLHIVDLTMRRNGKFKTFSLGMKQRLSLASALLGDPEILLLDEPTNGLDPQGIAEIRELIQQIAGLGVTIILASHMLDEVEKVCSHVAIIKNGSLMVQGPVDEILQSDPMMEIAANNMEQLKDILSQHPSVREIKESRQFFVITLNEGISTSELNEYAFKNGVILTHLRNKKKNLEAQFLEITN
ncbi:MAG: ABC transporter ATP-binding protein [Flavobacteriales bacterium]|nr:ABC transporter ATP-binding protein [Flavobacteriales bacterium]